MSTRRPYHPAGPVVRTTVAPPATFARWYRGNIMPDGSPYASDGQVIVLLSALAPAARRRALARPRGLTEQTRFPNRLDLAREVMCQAAKDRPPHAPRLLGENTRGLGGARLAWYDAGAPPSDAASGTIAVRPTATAVYSAVAVRWLDRNVRFDGVGILHGFSYLAMALYRAGEAAALLMPVYMDPSERFVPDEDAPGVDRGGEG